MIASRCSFNEVYVIAFFAPEILHNAPRAFVRSCVYSDFPRNVVPPNSNINVNKSIMNNNVERVSEEIKNSRMLLLCQTTKT